MLRLLATSTSVQTAAAAARRSPAVPLFAAYSTSTVSKSASHNPGSVFAAASAALVGLVAASAASEEGGSTARCQAAISPNEPVLKSPIVMVDKSGARLEGRPFRRCLYRSRKLRLNSFVLSHLENDASLKSTHGARTSRPTRRLRGGN